MGLLAISAQDAESHGYQIRTSISKRPCRHLAHDLTSMHLQPKLPRVLQEQEFEQLGSTRMIRVDVRVVAAANQGVPQIVHERRADVYYRLNVFRLSYPLERATGRYSSARASLCEQDRSTPGQGKYCIFRLEALRLYTWPRNFRELQNLLERALIMVYGARVASPSGATLHLS